jgi:hypothetical protein
LHRKQKRKEFEADIRKSRSKEERKEERKEDKAKKDEKQKKEDKPKEDAKELKRVLPLLILLLLQSYKFSLDLSTLLKFGFSAKFSSDLILRLRYRDLF